MNETLLNSTRETAYRLLHLFSIIGSEDPKSSLWISAIDFVAIYGKTFAVDRVDLHGGNWMKYAAYTPHIQLIDSALHYLAVRRLCQVGATPDGYRYSANDIGNELATRFATSYALQYKSSVEKTLMQYGSFDEQSLLSMIEKVAIAALRKENDNG